jgi:hypothetical protein
MTKIEKIQDLLSKVEEELTATTKAEVMKYKSAEIAKLAKTPIQKIMELASEVAPETAWPADANSFRAGIAFAAKLFADPDFDY